jgi:hypothetical protein
MPAVMGAPLSISSGADAVFLNTAPSVEQRQRRLSREFLNDLSVRSPDRGPLQPNARHALARLFGMAESTMWYVLVIAALLAALLIWWITRSTPHRGKLNPVLNAKALAASAAARRKAVQAVHQQNRPVSRLKFGKR